MALAGLLTLAMPLSAQEGPAAGAAPVVAADPLGTERRAPGPTTPETAPTALQEQGSGEPVTLDPSEMRGLAVAAAEAGRSREALRFAQALIRRDAEDPVAALVQARALRDLGRLDDARDAARRAWRLARAPRDRFAAARTRAQVLASAGNRSAAQFWLRRAANWAEDPRDRADIARDYGYLRQRNRLGLSFDLSVAPSSNVNGGAREAVSIADGVPLVGVLSPAAQALSGRVAEAGLRARYRLGDAPGRFVLHGEVQRRAIRLSREARAFAPELDGADLSSGYLLLGLGHRVPLAGSRSALTFAGYGARSWYGGAPSADTLRLDLSALHALSPETILQGGLHTQVQRDPSGIGVDVRSAGVRAGVVMRGPGDVRLGLTLHAAQSRSDNPQARLTRQALDLWLAPDSAFGPVEPRLRIALERNHYPDYRMLLAVPGGRRDDGLLAELDLTLPGLDWGGFVPRVTLSAGRTRSNVSRFDTDTRALRIGFDSLF